MSHQPSPPVSVYLDTLTDSRHWAHYVPRPGDIVVTTPPKSGTTWAQAIIALLLSGDPAIDVNPSENAPWFDNRFRDPEALMAELDARPGRRQVKTHTPIDGLPVWPETEYVAVYRHPIDTHFSFRRHVANYRPETAEMLGIDFSLLPEDPRESFRIFLESDHFDTPGLRMVVNHYRTWRAREPRQNFLRLHYADLTSDLPGNVARIAAHIGISHPPEVMARLVQAARFGNMKANPDRFGLVAGKDFWRNDAAFFDSATSGKWQGVLTEDDLAAYDREISGFLEPKERAWLEWGSSGDSD